MGPDRRINSWWVFPFFYERFCSSYSVFIARKLLVGDWYGKESSHACFLRCFCHFVHEIIHVKKRRRPAFDHLDVREHGSPEYVFFIQLVFYGPYSLVQPLE